jgi:hypothetical protein
MDFEKVNTIINTKTRQAKQALIEEQSKLGMKHGLNRTEPEPLTNINTRTSKNAGVINRIRFRFKKSGVFVHKGVGKGTPIEKVGSTNRKPKPWFNPVIEKYANEMMEEVADEYVDVAFNQILIR